MKKLLAILLALALALCVPALAEPGAADVLMEGETYHLVLVDVYVAEGQLHVVLSGFGDTLRMGPNGWMLAAWPEAHFGE